jgi:hypothetical protein
MISRSEMGTSDAEGIRGMVMPTVNIAVVTVQCHCMTSMRVSGPTQEAGEQLLWPIESMTFDLFNSFAKG